MAAKRFALAMLMMALLAGCAAPVPERSYLALLAPFEGRYREVGYDLLYAARLALADGDYAHIALLPVDDGGTAALAEARARALALNPRVRVVMVAGRHATQPETLRAFDNLPVVVIGLWNAQPLDGVFILSSAQAADALTAPPGIGVEAAAALPTPVSGGEVFALKQFPLLRPDLTGITVVSSAQPADAAFTERYLRSGEFVQPPGLLVTLGYDAARLTADALAGDTPTRRAVRDRIRLTEYTGITGLIRFEDGYWADAPLHRYRYTAEGTLTLTR